MLKHLSIKARLTVAAVLAVVGVVTLAAFNLYSGRTGSAALSAVYEDSVRDLVQYQKVDSALREVRYRVAGVLLDTMPIQGSLNHLKEARAEIGAAWSSLDSNKAALGSDETKLKDEMRQGYANVERVLGRIEQAYAAKNNAQLTEVLETDWAQLHKTFIKPMQALIPIKEAEAKAVYEGAVKTNATLMTVSIVLALVLGAAVMAACIWVTRSVRAPLAQMSDAVRAMAAGDLSSEIEIGAQHEIGRLMAEIRDMQTGLRRLVGSIHSSVDSISTGSREIAQGNHDLSSRTEQQASSLQQTSASMEQMTSAVKQNADAARQANQLAVSASQVAEKGGAVVDQVVSTMEDITASSRKIADIIGVIDGIAFQTNILALNAAVEAARAGEQGRGFAVVAAEVRNLAQRSAQAAREIKSLISDSVGKVENGSRQVQEAGSTMAEIVTQVKRVTDLIGEITSSTLEQSSGITQVNQAVTQLDQMTQQNAALVEQSAAAAQSLKEQADRLAQAVAVFKLSRQQTHNVIAQAKASSAGVVAPPPKVAGSAKTPAAARPAAPKPVEPAKPLASRPARPSPTKDDDWKEF